MDLSKMPIRGLNDACFAGSARFTGLVVAWLVGQTQNRALTLSILSILAVSTLACQGSPSPTISNEDAALPDSQLVSSTRGGKIYLFPCSDCHNKIPGERPFSYDQKHMDLQFAHFVGIKQCRMCHNEHDMNSLRLFTGEIIAIDDSQRLCGQCHGEKLRDWSIGAHGKFVGGWKGKKHRQTCADCHHPHTPGRAQVLAQPAPPFPQFGIPKGAHE